MPSLSKDSIVYFPSTQRYEALLTQSAEGELRQPGGLLICRPMTLRPHLAMGLPFRDAQPIGFGLYIPPAPVAHVTQKHPLDLCFSSRR
jgi:hypothetical protein